MGPAVTFFSVSIITFGVKMFLKVQLRVYGFIIRNSRPSLVYLGPSGARVGLSFKKGYFMTES